MKIKTLIKLLEKYPKNMDIALWNGYEQVAITNIKVDEHIMERLAIGKKAAKLLSEKNNNENIDPYFSEWSDFSYHRNSKFHQKKNMLLIQPRKPLETIKT